MGRIGRRRWSVAAAPLLVSAALLAGACSSGSSGSGSTGPTVPDDAPTSTTAAPPTTTTPASYDVPATIDQAYVQRVLTSYDHALGEGIRVLKRDRAVSDEFLKYLVGIYTASEFEFQQQAWEQAVNEGRIDKTPPTPGDPKTTLIGLPRADGRCIVARADTDMAATLNVGEPQAHTAHDQYIVLVPKASGRDPLAINPTPWAVAFDGSKGDNSVPESACDA